MNSAPIYIATRAFYRIGEFFRHWYIKSMKIYWYFVLNQLYKIDYRLAWKITLRNFFKPLYKDYTVTGYIFGFAFRSIRLLIGSVTYLVIFAAAAVVYIIWLLIPVIIIINVFGLI